MSDISLFAAVPDVPYQNLGMFARGVNITVKRIDLVHPFISGNKWFKLRPNLVAAHEQGKTTLISFGGAYSNHLHALAYAARECGFRAVGVVRGEELAHQPLNPTLQDAFDCGMTLRFIDRAQYRQKNTPDFLATLQDAYPNAYIIAEGGSNAAAVASCADILTERDKRDFDLIVCAVGTGGTLAGIINAASPRQNVLGFAALAADLGGDIRQWLRRENKGTQWRVLPDDVFGGYGRFNAQLLDFIADCRARYDVPLDPIYTGKAFYRLQKAIEQGDIQSGARVLFVHSGGLQGARTGKLC